MKRAGFMGFVLACVVLFGMTGCAMLNKVSLQNNRNTTIGRELIDLQEAREKNAITEEEYKELKEKIKETGFVAPERCKDCKHK